MNILTLDPEDSPWKGPWAHRRWDLVIDFGWAGWNAYREWQTRLGCPVLNVYDTAQPIEDLKEVNRLIDASRGRLVDDEGFDWWDVWSPVYRWDMEVVHCMARLARQIERGATIFTTRPSLHAAALGAFLGTDVRPVAGLRQTAFERRLRRYGVAASTLRPRQVLQIAYDKWDPMYALRSRFAPAPPETTGPITLLPSGYSNVSHSLAAYASMLPGRQFLLVSTRPDGEASGLPANIRSAGLASYVSPPRPDEIGEIQRLRSMWTRVAREIADSGPVLAVAERLGVFAERLPRLLERGVRLRRAWRTVFETHDVAAVLCGDENNPLARLPLMLARQRGVPAVSCHHGALDFQPLVKELAADVYLVKGEMERDYLVRVCGVAPERTFIGAPGDSKPPSATHRSSIQDAIVFFSEPYDLQLGRVEDLYRDVLPRLCDVAAETNRKVLVKLHPFESRRGRIALVESLLTESQLERVEVVTGPLTPGLMARAWCGISVESSVAVDCTLEQIPCFLCGWFDVIRHDYQRQYARFGAGQRLETPDDLRRLPALVPHARPSHHVLRRLREPIAPADLEKLLSGQRPEQPATAETSPMLEAV